MRSIGNVQFAVAQGIPLLLDIHLPDHPTSTPLPVVIFVHGGGWRGGVKENPPGLSFIEHGFALVSINYRVTGQAIWPAQIHDCKAAVRWVRANSEQYGFDPTRIGAWGSSAGGHLVAMLAVSGDSPELEGSLGTTGVSSAIQACCNWCGPTDLTELHNPAWRVEEQNLIAEVTEALIGGPLDQHLDAAHQASPALHIKRGCPPVFTMQGVADQVVSHRHAQPFHDRMLSCGNDSELHLLEGAKHGFWTTEREQMVLAFFQRTLSSTMSWPGLDTGGR